MAQFKNKKKWTLFAAAALTVFSLAGCGAGNAAFPADTYTIEKQDLINSINVSGTVKGTELVNITSTVGAPIISLNVQLGDYVKKGDVLCTFDKTALQEEYDNLEKTIKQSEEMQKNTHEINQRNLQNAKDDKNTAVQQAQRGIDEAKSARDNAYNKFNDLESKCSEAAWQRDDLYNQYIESDDDGTGSFAKAYAAAAGKCEELEMTRDSLREQLSSYDSAVKSAEEAYNSVVRSCDSLIQSCQDVIDAEKYSTDDSSKAQLSKLKEKLDNCVVKAPMDGLITALNVAEGNIPTTDTIMTIEDDSALKISATVREADIFSIETGMKALVKTTATKDKEFVGEVTKVVKIYSPPSYEGYTEIPGGYIVEITAKDTGDLYIGMNAKADIIIDEKKDAFAVPYDSIVQDENNDSVVYIAREQEGDLYTAEAVKVTPQMETDYFIEIVSDEIKEGDIIVTTPEYMSEGAKFTVRSGGIESNE